MPFCSICFARWYQHRDERDSWKKYHNHMSYFKGSITHNTCEHKCKDCGGNDHTGWDCDEDLTSTEFCEVCAKGVVDFHISNGAILNNYVNNIETHGTKEHYCGGCAKRVNDHIGVVCEKVSCIKCGEDGHRSYVCEYFKKEEEKDEDVKEGEECVVCMVKKKTHLFTPCGHLCVCKKCAKKVKNEFNECPMCKIEIEGICQVYF